MHGVLSASRTVLFQFQFYLEFLFVFLGIVVYFVALGALEFDKIILRHLIILLNCYIVKKILLTTHYQLQTNFHSRAHGERDGNVFN